MKTNEFTKPVTASQLNENMYKKFGVKVNFDKYDREQLENYRNLLRTKINQVEGSANFNDLLANESYQKDKHLVNLLNTRIKEMLGEGKKAKPDFLDMDKDGDKKEPMKKAVADKKKGAAPKKGVNTFAKKDESVEEGWEDMMAANKKAAKEKGTGKFDKKKTSTGTVYTRKSSTFTDGGEDREVKKAKKKVKESFQYVREDEEAKAKSITAGADMVNDFTSWMTRVGQYQTKSMIELADAIRANFGAEQSEAFKASVAPALETALNTLTQVREEISNAVAVLSGEAPAMDQMGGDMDGMDDMNAGSEEIPGSEDELGMDMGADEFGASDAAAGGAEEAGRMRRESRQTFARKLSEAHSLLKTLSK